jgi:hypothetical protein
LVFCATYGVTPNRRISATKFEGVLGWIKTTGGLRKIRHRGTALVGWMFTLTAAAYNLVRMPKLLAAAAASWQGSVPRHDSRPAAQQKSKKSARHVPFERHQAPEICEIRALFCNLLTVGRCLHG